MNDSIMGWLCGGLVAILGVYILVTWVEIPIVLISHSSGECVEVIHGDYDCQNLPDRYSIEYTR